jgi:hypothetical protein
MTKLVEVYIWLGVVGVVHLLTGWPVANMMLVAIYTQIVLVKAEKDNA